MRRRNDVCIRLGQNTHKRRTAIVETGIHEAQRDSATQRLGGGVAVLLRVAHVLLQAGDDAVDKVRRRRREHQLLEGAIGWETRGVETTSARKENADKQRLGHVAHRRVGDFLQHVDLGRKLVLLHRLDVAVKASRRLLEVMHAEAVADGEGARRTTQGRRDYTTLI